MPSQHNSSSDFCHPSHFRRKRRLTFVGFAIRRFMVGVNYSIVIPSLWFYLDSFGAPYYFFGLALAADWFVGFLISPIVGKISDLTRQIRIIGSITISMDIIGNLVYAWPLHVYMPILGRCIVGLGTGYASALYGEVARVTTPDERTRMVTILEGLRLLGITLGPSFNLFLQQFDFNIGSWKIDERTAPGVFMAIVWVFVAVVHLLTVQNLTKNYKDLEDDYLYKLEGKRGKQPQCRLKDESQGLWVDTTVLPEDDVEPLRDQTASVKLVDQLESQSSHQDLDLANTNKNLSTYLRPSKDPSNDEDCESPRHQELTYFDILKAQRFKVREKGKGRTFSERLKVVFSRSELLALFLTQYFMYFIQSGFETLAPLIAVELNDFTITWVSILYFVGGIELLLVVVSVWFVSRYMEDRSILLASMTMATIGVLAQLGVAMTQPHSSGCLTMGLLMAFFMLLAPPINAIVGKSLVSKITPPEDQGFYQGVLASIVNLGFITAPPFSSALFHHLAWFSAGSLLTILIDYIWILSVMERLTNQSKS